MAQLPHSLDYLRQVLADYFADKPVRRVEAFGSYARGEAAAEPDLDLLLGLIYPVGREWLRYAAESGGLPGTKVAIGTSASDYVTHYIKKDLRTIYEHPEKQAA